jgi:hypothetical protein
MIELEEYQTAYAHACNADNLRALPTEQFVESLKRFCRACRIKMKIVSGKASLMDVALGSHG